jgi:hypothetical protein
MLLALTLNASLSRAQRVLQLRLAQSERKEFFPTAQCKG